MKHSIVIPAYNEEKRVGNTLKDYIKFLSAKGLNYELVVVCDGCKDRTVDVVKQFARKNKRVRLLEVGRRLGKGGGVYYGFAKCTGDTIGFSDADNAIKPAEYYKLLTALSSADCVIASRRQKNSVIVIPAAKKSWVFAMQVASRVYNVLVNVLFWLNIKDTQCGAKVMKKEVYRAIKGEIYVHGFEFDVELLWRIKKHGYRIKEVGIRWIHDLDSKSSIKNSAKMFLSLLRRRLSG